MRATYTPRPGSLAAHACAWFQANPGRKLTLAQICGRWGGTAHTATAQLGAAEDAEFLLSERIGRTDVYSAGPKLHSWTPLNDSLAEAKAFDPAAAPLAPLVPVAAPAPSATKKPAPLRARLPELDIANLQVKSAGLLAPVRGGPHAKGRSRWRPLLEKLAAPDTFVEVPSTYVGALNKAINAYRKEQPQRVLRLVKASTTHHQLQRLADKKAGTQ